MDTRLTSGLAHEDDAKDARLLAAYTIKATIWLLVATAAGLLISFKYRYPDLQTSPVLSFGRLRAIHVNRARPASIDMINVNDAGVFFICDDDAADAIRPVVGAGMRGTSGVMYRVVKTITEAGVEIIHSTDSNIAISIVAADQAAVAEQALHDAFRLGRGRVAR